MFFKFRLRIQLLIIVCSLLIFSIATVSIFSIKNTSTLMGDIEKASNVEVVENTIQDIDITKFEQVLKEGEDNPYYDTLRTNLEKIKNINGLEYLYTMAKIDGKYHYIVDGNSKNDKENFSPYMSVEENPDESLKEVFESGELVAEDMNTYNETPVITVYMPIKSANGETIAVLGVDKNVSYIMDKTKEYILHMTTIALIILVIVITLIYIYTYKFTRRLNTITYSLEELSKGNVDVVIEKTNSKDEINDILDSVVILRDTLKSFMGGLRNNSATLGHTSENLSEMVDRNRTIFDNLLKDTENIECLVSTQNDNIQLVFKYTNDNLEIIKEILTFLSELNTLNEENIASNSNSEVMLKNISSALTDMGDNIDVSSTKLLHLNKELKKVTDILKIIDDISSRTNLLSLNASIESARAGEFGKGFSVVANEIRNLSNNTSNAVVDIGKVLNNLIEISNETISEFNNVVESSNNNGMIVQNLNAFIEEMKDNNTSYTRILEDVMDIQSTCLENSDVVKNNLDTITKDSSTILNDIKNLTEDLATFSNNVEMIKEISEDTKGNSLELNQLAVDFDKQK